MATLRETTRRLKAAGDPARLAGMARVGIVTRRAYGVSISDIRRLARSIGRDHDLAGKLWAAGVRETRILATMIEEPDRITGEQMEEWVGGVDSWDVCDHMCSLFGRTALAIPKAVEWSTREEEFIKRAAFALIAAAAVHDKSAGDRVFERLLPVIRAQTTDERNYVKKAVNWALRQIGKRNVRLNEKAIETARRIHLIDSKAARWIASDALRELTSEAVRARLDAPPPAAERAPTTPVRREPAP